MTATLFLRPTGYPVDGKEACLEVRSYDGIEVNWSRVGTFGWGTARLIEATGQVTWWGDDTASKATHCKFCDRLRTSPCKSAHDIRAASGRFKNAECKIVLERFGDLLPPEGK
jgi:hypothetical protein